MTKDAGVVHTRSAHEVLAWSGGLVGPAVREALDGLPASIRRIARFHFGRYEPDGPTGAGVGDKPIHPALVLLAAQATGADPPAARQRQLLSASVATPAAVAVELVRGFALTRDLTDGVPTGRPRPTLGSGFGTGAAILGGGALLSVAFEVLVASGHPAAPAAVRMLGAATLDLLEGRGNVARQESATLLGCACALGATFAGAAAAQVALLRDFGQQLGLAIQHAEPVGRAGGLGWRQAKVDELLADATRALRSAVDPTGPAAAELGALARWAVRPR